MAHAHSCWIPKATNTHSDCAIIFAFPQQKWLQKRTLMFHYAYIASLVLLVFTSFGADKQMYTKRPSHGTWLRKIFCIRHSSHNPIYIYIYIYIYNYFSPRIVKTARDKTVLSDGWPYLGASTILWSVADYYYKSEKNYIVITAATW